MSKKNFVSLIFATVGGILFALGMCMALLPAWDAFRQGVVLGAAAVVAGVLFKNRPKYLKGAFQ